MLRSHYSLNIKTHTHHIWYDNLWLYHPIHHLLSVSILFFRFQQLGGVHNDIAPDTMPELLTALRQAPVALVLAGISRRREFHADGALFPGEQRWNTGGVVG